MAGEAVSEHYREITLEEIPGINTDAWKDPLIPKRQYDLVVKLEMEEFRKGNLKEPYAALLRCFEQIPVMELGYPNVLDIGAASGYASEILERAGHKVRYTGVDFSKAFKDLAEEIYPGIDFQVADARTLPFHDDFFEIVLSSACIMHIKEYEQAVNEAIRVARRFVVFHRMAVTDYPTTYFSKEAYGVQCLEVHINETELLKMFEREGCELLYVTEVYKGYRSYLVYKKDRLFHHNV